VHLTNSGRIHASQASDWYKEPRYLRTSSKGGAEVMRKHEQWHLPAISQASDWVQRDRAISNISKGRGRRVSAPLQAGGAYMHLTDCR
jgi:hypothetical protein